MKQIPLHWQIFIAILFAIPFGYIYKATEVQVLLSGYEFLGNFFINALKMLIVPLIMSAIITGISNVANGRGFARLGLKTIGYYATTSLIAILTGLFLVNLTMPGISNGIPVKDTLGFSAMTAEKVAAVSGKGASDIVDIFLRMIPTNVVDAAANGQMLGLITFSLLFGYFMMKIPKQYSDSQLSFWNGVYEIMLKITHLVMRFAPFGVFGLIAKTVAKTGLDSIAPLAIFFFTVLVALAFHMFITMGIILKVVGKINPLDHFKNMTPALLTAFSTSSSSATLPETMDRVQKSGTSKKITSFVLPLGATVNMDGTALYECVAAMFIAQAYGIELGFTTQLIIVLVALLTSIGVAGIPSASLVAIVIVLSAIGLPAEGIGLILAVDRILDMCRTSVNVFSDSCGAVIIAKSEGETPYLRS